MKKYIEFNKNDELKARYDSTIHSSIPQSAIEVSETLFRQTICQSDGIWKLNGVTGEISKYDFPPPVKKHDQLWESIKVLRTDKQAAGIPVEHEGKRLWFNSDERSRALHQALKTEGEALPAGLEWKTLTNDFVMMSPALAAAIATATILHDDAIFAAAEQHRQVMLGLDDPTDYDFGSGWPQTYQDVLDEAARIAAAGSMEESMAEATSLDMAESDVDDDNTDLHSALSAQNQRIDAMITKNDALQLDMAEIKAQLAQLVQFQKR